MRMLIACCLLTGCRPPLDECHAEVAHKIELSVEGHRDMLRGMDPCMVGTVDRVFDYTAKAFDWWVVTMDAYKTPHADRFDRLAKTINALREQSKILAGRCDQHD